MENAGTAAAQAPLARRPVPRPSNALKPAKKGAAPNREFPLIAVLIAGGAIGALLVAVFGGPPLIRQVRLMSAHSRIAKVVAANHSAEKIVPDLPYFLSFSSGETDPQRQQVLSSMLLQLGSDKALEHVLPVSNDSFLFPVVVQLAQTQPQTWLLERSNDSDARIRRVAASALLTHLPLGTAPDDVRDSLGEPLSSEEKKKQFDELYAKQHLQVEQQIVGPWQLRINSEYQDGGNSTPGTFSMAGMPLTVSCQEKLWTVDFFGQKWSGDLAQLRAMSIKVPVRPALAGFSFLQEISDISGQNLVFQLTMAAATPSVQVVGYPKFKKDEPWRVEDVKDNRIKTAMFEYHLRTPSGANVLSVSIKDTIIKPGVGKIEIEAEGGSDGFYVAKWRIQGKPGFTRIEVSAIRTN